MAVKTSDVILIIIAIIFPPAAVAILTGCSMDLAINILLTILGITPGHLHVFWLIYKKLKAEEGNGYNGGLFYPYGPTGPSYPTEGILLPTVPANQEKSSPPQLTTSGNRVWRGTK